VQLSNARIWITGASRGIGYEIALQALQSGAKVCLMSRSEADISRFAEEYRQNILLFRGSVANRQHMEQCALEIRQKFGGLDILINNAGLATFAPLAETTYDQAKQMLDINVLGVFNAIQASLPMLIDKPVQKPAFILTVHSIAAVHTFPNCALYSATKSATLAMMKSLREELRENGISIIDILPGATATEIWNTDTLQEYSYRMMSSKEVASTIIQALQISRQHDDASMCIEQIILRPWQGDLP
jgi:short-subunit dehydrogenase